MKGADSTESPAPAMVLLPGGRSALPGRLSRPRDAIGLVIFSRPSGVSGHAPPSRDLVSALSGAGLATLEFDLLDPGEQEHPGRRYDVDLLAGRLEAVLDWTRRRPDVGRLPVGLLAGGTGASATLKVSAESGTPVHAIVSRSGRPDLVPPGVLERVTAPTLFVVGERDERILSDNLRAMRRLGAPCRLAAIPGAGHFFEEPGALARADRETTDWFRRHLPSVRVP